MKKIFLYSLLLAGLVWASCSKDLGNYTYHTVNQVSFDNFDTLNGYTVFYNDTLSISPVLTMSQDKTPSPANYVYQWSFRILSGTDSVDSVVAVTPNLHIQVKLSPGTYTLQYRVKDSTTGITFQQRTSVLVSSEVYEGFLILNDVNGQSRLDMLSYAKTAGTFSQYTDVLAKEESPLTLQGQPYQVLCMPWTNTNISAQNYGIFLLTSGGTTRINQETFGWEQTYDITYLMIGDVPPNFAAQRLTGEPTYGIYPDFYMCYNSNIYSYSVFAGYAFKYTPLNVYAAGDNPFTVSPYVATDGSSALMYDMDAKNFVTAASYSSVSVTTAPVTLNYPTGEDLVYMERNYSGYVYAVLKDTTASPVYYLLRTKLGQAQNYYQPITGTDIASATCFAVSPDLGYLFYSVGGKVYEYDLSLQTSTLMVDKGSSVISYLNFHEFLNKATNTTYAGWAKELIVGSYDPAGTPGSNGTLELYSVPPVNGQIIRTNQWTGMGKIVSVAYRER